MEEKKILHRDLEILTQMSLELEPYLMSDAEQWPMARGDMPRMSLGGCLMRCHRLPKLAHLLDHSVRLRVNLAIDRVEAVLALNLVRSEARANQELSLRASQWIGHLRDWVKQPRVSPKEYASSVDTRVVIDTLLQFLRRPNYQMRADLAAQIASIDTHLRRCWDDGDFVWVPLWQPAYPQQEYWYLYGGPQCKADREGLLAQLAVPVPTRPVR